jgi:peptidyl-prolyl cis-trans isomerase D
MIKQTRDFNYAAISFAQYLPKISISTEQAQQYYQTNLQKFLVWRNQTVEKIRVNYLVLSDKQIREKINPSMSQLQEFYQTTISNYTQPEQWQIAHIVIANDTNDLAITKEKLNKIAIALKAKKDFSSLAKQYSDELISAKKGGLLPWLSIASLPPTIQNAVSKLKVGDVSVPIQTADGYEIIKLIF